MILQQAGSLSAGVAPEGLKIEDLRKYLKKYKSKSVAYILLIIWGMLGIHKFYLKKVWLGILYMLTGGILLFGVFVDLFLLSGEVDKYNEGIKIND